MHPLWQFLQSEPILALLIAVLIFLVTIFLVVKQWIGFSITLLLLLFSLAAGLLVSNQQMLRGYASDYRLKHLQDNSQDAFKKQIVQAVEDLKAEVDSEKENLRHVVTQVQDIFDQMDTQKQELQQFIEETKERFKVEASTKTSNEENRPHAGGSEKSP